MTTCIINHFNSIKALTSCESSLHCHRHSLMPVVRFLEVVKYSRHPLQLTPIITPNYSLLSSPSSSLLTLVLTLVLITHSCPHPRPHYSLLCSPSSSLLTLVLTLILITHSCPHPCPYYSLLSSPLSSLLTLVLTLVLITHPRPHY